MAKKRKLKKYDAVIGERADGVKVTKPFYGLTIAEAKEKARLYQEEVGNAQSKITNSEFYFRGWAKRWLVTYKKPFISENAYYTTYESPVFQHLLPEFGDFLMVDITPEQVQSFYNNKSFLSKSMCGKIQMCLNAIFETAIDNDTCYKNPARFCVLQSKRIPNLKEVYEDDQIAAAERWFLFRMPEVVLILETGVRREEMAGWYKTDFDLRRHVYHVQRAVISLRGGEMKEVPPKNNSYRTNPLSPIAAQAYKILCERNHGSKYLVADENGGPIHPERWSDRLRAQMEIFSRENKAPALTSHELRHTYGTYLRRNKVDIYTIAKVLGHKSIEVTSNTYVHNEITALRKALKFINKQELIA